LKRILLYLGGLFIPFLCSTNASAQAPSISYTPTTNVFTVGSVITALIPANSGGVVPATTYATVSTLLGTGTLSNPQAIATDGTNVYVADYGNNRIRKVTTAGVVSVLAGSGIAAETDGTGAAAAFNGPDGIAYDGSGNLYVADAGGNKIRKIVISSGVVTTIAGTGAPTPVTNSTPLTSTFNGPAGLDIDASGNIYIADQGNQLIRMISGGTVTTLAGTAGTAGSTNGTGTAASFSSPNDLVADNLGNVFVIDYLNNQVRQIVISTQVVTTFAGSGAAGSVDGTGTAATFNRPGSICLDASGNLIIGDLSNKIRLITPAAVVTTIAGSGAAAETNGVGTAAALYSPGGVATDNSGNLYTTDFEAGTGTNATVRKVVLTGYKITPALPAGLTFTVTSGKISGTPTALSSATNYTITGYNASGSSSDNITIQCVQTNNWTSGSNTTAWGTAGNWSKGVPGVNDAVEIGVTAYTKNNQPKLSASTTVSSITFGSVKQGVLTIATGNTLTIGNNLTINTGATGATIIGAGTAALDIAPAATISINGTGVLTLTSPLSITLQSSAAGDASIGPITTTNFTGTAITSINVQRYLTGGAAKYRGYRLISSPVTSGSGDYTINYLKNSIYLTGTSTSGGFDNTAVANPTLYLYRENLTTPSNTTFTGSNFRGINNLTTSPLYGMDDTTYPTTNIPVGNGILCFFRGDRSVNTFAQETVTAYVPASTTLSTSGALNIGNITVKDWFTPGLTNLSFTATSPFAGFNLVGNPYASPIDWDTFQSTSLATGGIYGTFITSNTMYILDPISHNYGVYQANSGGSGTNDATNIISSGQGFFVKASSISAQLVFTESAKTSSQNTGSNLTMAKRINLATTTPVNNQYLHLKLAKDAVNSDETMVRFNNQASTKFDQALDALYETGYGSVSLSGLTSDKVKFAIATMPLPGLQQESIPLSINVNTDGIYSLTLKDIVAVPQLFDIWLMDAYKKDSLDIRHNLTYSFNVHRSDTTSFGSNRFSLVIRQNPGYAYRLLNFTAQKIQGARQIQVNWNTANEGNYTNFIVQRSVDGGKTFDVLGSVTASGAGQYSLADKNPVSGQNLYRLQQQDINNSITYSNVVTILYSDLSNGLVNNKLSIYPNPVKDNISLTIAEQLTGNTSYNITFMNSSGIIIKQVTSEQTTWQGSVSNLQPGTYVVQVVNNKNVTLVGQTKFVKF
jgi:trimeric autotransporter adhesin